MQIQPNSLKTTRERIGLTIEEAAESVRVSKRTWQAYESPPGHNSSRTISAGHLELFCLKHNLPFPPVRLDGSPTVGDTRIVSIVGGTGGAGRTTISLELGRTLARANYSVAVVTDADYLSQDNYQFTNPRILRRPSVLLRDSELMDLRIRLRAAGLLDAQDSYIPQGTLTDTFAGKAWQRKTLPEGTLRQLKADTDFVLLDLGRELDTAILLSDVVLLTFDLERNDAFTSNRNVFQKTLARNVEYGASPKLFTLLTNKKPSRRQDRVYAAAHRFGLPILHTTLSHAQVLAQRRLEERFWAGQGPTKKPEEWEFELISDVDPASTAALEYLSLADELLVELNKLDGLKEKPRAAPGGSPR